MPKKTAITAKILHKIPSTIAVILASLPSSITFSQFLLKQKPCSLFGIKPMSKRDLVIFTMTESNLLKGMKKGKIQLWFNNKNREYMFLGAGKDFL